MHLKIHATLPGSTFNLKSSLNLLPFHALLNTLFKRIVHIPPESSYTYTLEKARELKLFENGWLPDILPATSRKIRCENHPILEYAHGEFYFSDDDWGQFSKKLQPGNNVIAPFVNWANSVRKMRGERHSVWQYQEQSRHWMFFYKEGVGYCEYVMWVGRVGRGNKKTVNMYQRGITVHLFSL